MRSMAMVLAGLAIAPAVAGLGATVPMRTIAFYDIGFGNPGAAPRYQVLEDAAEWSAFYAQIGRAAPESPDLAQEVVLAADQGSRSQECGFGIRMVQEPADGARVATVYNAVTPRVTSVCLQVLVHDVHLVAVPRAAGLYAFVDEVSGMPVGTDVVR